MVSSLSLRSHRQIYLTKLLVKVRLSGRREECLSYPRKDWPSHWWDCGEVWGGRDKVKSLCSATLQASSLSCATESSTGQHQLQ